MVQQYGISNPWSCSQWSCTSPELYSASLAIHNQDWLWANFVQVSNTFHVRECLETHTHTHIWEENYVGKQKGCRDGPVKSRGTRLGWKHRTTTPLQEHGEKRQEDYRMSVTLLGQLNTRMRDHLGITSDSDPWRTRTGQRKDSKLGCLKFRQLQNLQTDLQAVYKQ